MEVIERTGATTSGEELLRARPTVPSSVRERSNRLAADLISLKTSAACQDLAGGVVA
jgi:hypothetical protein